MNATEIEKILTKHGVSQPNELSKALAEILKGVPTVDKHKIERAMQGL